ncbi:MAG: TrmH family RNA methyltransferase [Thainema sp.]
MLTSLQNPLIKAIRKLHRTKGRRQQQQFLLEGTHLIQEACSVAYPLQVVCHTEEWQQRYPALWQTVQQQAERIEVVSPDVLAALATTVQPDGVVATAPRRTAISESEKDASGDRTLGTSQAFLGLMLETLQDPGNLGGIIRTAAATGIDQLWVSADSVDVDHPKVLRSSAGQWFRAPTLTCAEPVAIARQLQQQGVQIIATRPDAAQVYWDVDLRSPTLLLMGNEGAGLSPDLTDLADLSITIPLSPGVESLNVTISAALVLYEAKRQRRD